MYRFIFTGVAISESQGFMMGLAFILEVGAEIIFLAWFELRETRQNETEN